MGYEEKFKKIIGYSFLAFTLTSGGIYIANQINEQTKEEQPSELEKKIQLEEYPTINQGMYPSRATMVEMHSYFNP